MFLATEELDRLGGRRAGGVVVSPKDEPEGEGVDDIGAAAGDEPVAKDVDVLGAAEVSDEPVAADVDGIGIAAARDERGAVPCAPHAVLLVARQIAGTTAAILNLCM